MVNNRIFFSCHAIAIAPLGTFTFTAAHRVLGAQSVGITTTFNLEQVFELGQLSIYENIENIPDIEITASKVLDGHQLIYHKATPGAVTDTLTGRSTQRCMFGLGVFNDAQNSASGVPVAECVISGADISSLAYSFPTEGNCTESVTLVANDKQWFQAPGSPRFGSLFLNTDLPIANFYISGSGGVQRREDVLFGGTSGTLTLDENSYVNDSLNRLTILPSLIPGISTSGTNDQNATATAFNAHIGTISVQTNLGREALNELGRRSPDFRFVTFPIEVTCSIETIASAGDNVSATEAGTLGNGNNLSNCTIKIATKDGTFLNLGTRNKLASVSYTGGDATGGNVAVTYNFSNFNDLIVSHPKSAGETY